MKKYAWKFGILVSGLLLFYSSMIFVCAAEGATVVERYTTEDGLILYIRGVENAAWEATYQIGTVACKVDSIQTIRDTGESVYTLILWDNSRSFMKKGGDKIKDILMNVVANRIPGEKFAIAIPDKEITYLTDYGSDFSSLKQVIQNVEGENKDTYIVQSLYEAIVSLNQMQDFGYKRIILISDGEDSTDTGYSLKELNALIEKTPYPIYTIGVLVGDEQEGLQDLYALSRATGAEYFCLDEIPDVMTIVQAFSVDYDMLCVRVNIPAEMQDGSTQNSRLTLTAGTERLTVQSQVELPFLSIMTGGTDENIQESGRGEENAETDVDAYEGTVSGTFEESGSSSQYGILPVLIAALAFVVLATAIGGIHVYRKKGKKVETDDDYSKLDIGLKNPLSDSSHKGNKSVSGSEDRLIGEGKKTGETYPLGGDTVHLSGGTKTRIIRREDSIHKIIFTNITKPKEVFQCKMTDRITIGREAVYCNLAISTNNTISAIHCELSLENNLFFIMDLDSSNGTMVNGVLINNKTEVKTGDIIGLGTAQYCLSVE